jgi:type IV secretory pathway VirD2 relaxase
MSNYKGVIIEESLEDKEILKKVKIVSTKVEVVAKRHETPWIKQWIMYAVEIPDGEAEMIAETLSKSLDREHEWYADFKNGTNHYIIFRDKIFCIDRNSKGQYEEAKRYGLSLGIPEYQVDFAPDDEVWGR